MATGLLKVQKLAMNDITFRSRLISDPINTIKKAGIILEKSEVITVQNEIERLKANKTIKEIDEVFRTGALGW